MTEPKYRHELKYIISQAEYEILKLRLSKVTELDSHVMGTGKYNIRSVYFDDYYDRYFYENLSGTDPREKFRIRIYNHDSSRISLECKRKERGKTLKTACLITKEQCERITRGDYLSGVNEQPPVMRKLTNEMRLHNLKPVVIVEYERIPYVYKQGNVRITLDTNISSSQAINRFFDEVIPKRPVLQTGMQLLEVKYDEFLPDFIYQSLQLENLQQTAFSKYFLCRQYNMGIK